MLGGWLDDDDDDDDNEEVNEKDDEDERNDDVLDDLGFVNPKRFDCSCSLFSIGRLLVGDIELVSLAAKLSAESFSRWFIESGKPIKV